MSSDEKIMEGRGEGSSHETPQAITIHIVAPSDLETNSTDSALVASVETQDTNQESDSSLLVVPVEGDEPISVSAKNIIQTVTETNEDLPVISNINSDQVAEHSIEYVTVTKDEKHVPVEEIVEEDIGCHCLICNEELQEEDNVPVFKSFTETSQRKVSIFLGDLVGQKLTSRKTHSTIICSQCFKLLNKLDLLEFEVQETKEKIITKYQGTVAAYGGRARRKKSSAARKSDYVFPKIEPEDEDKVGLEVDGDEIYQPQVDDLMEEEQDKREDRDSMDEEWEPEIKRARIKRESSSDPNGPPKKKRGRPRKDATSSKSYIDVYEVYTSKELKVAQECKVLKTVTILEKEMPNQLSNTNKPIAKGDGDSTKEFIPPVTTFRPAIIHPSTIVKKIETVQSVPTSSTSSVRNSFSQPTNPTSSKADEEKDKKGVVLHQQCEKEKEFDHLIISSAKESLEKNEVKLFVDKQCPVCETSFPILTGMKDHFKNYHPLVESLICQHCKSILPPDIQFFLNHCKTCYPKELQFKGNKFCYICQKTLLKYEYWNHMASHKVQADRSVLSKEDFCSSKDISKFNDRQCPVCEAGFFGFFEVLYHFMAHHSSVEYLTCKHCKLELLACLGLPHYMRHCKDCFPKEQQLIKHPNISFCGVCQEEMTASKYINHLATSHKVLPCPVCREEFSRNLLRKHMVTHKRTIFKCVDCSFVYERANELLAHRRRNHLGNKGRPHLCENCGQKFVNITELRTHMRIQHEKIRKFVCDDCGESFHTSSYLTIHRRSHTGERPFKCKMCSKSYSRSSDLSKHSHKVHKMEYQGRNRVYKQKHKQNNGILIGLDYRI